MKQLIRNYPEYKRLKYAGAFPEGFEEELLEWLDYPEDEEILQVFGGKARYGWKMDINAKANPNLFGDAHKLPFKDNVFKAVICDPPYSNHDNYIYYGNQSDLFYDEWINEACRVSCEYVFTRHIKLLPCPKDYFEYMRVFITLCPNRYIHVAQIFKQ